MFDYFDAFYSSCVLSDRVKTQMQSSDITKNLLHVSAHANYILVIIRQREESLMATETKITVITNIDSCVSNSTILI